MQNRAMLIFVEEPVIKPNPLRMKSISDVGEYKRMLDKTRIDSSVKHALKPDPLARRSVSDGHSASSSDSNRSDSSEERGQRKSVLRSELASGRDRRSGGVQFGDETSIQFDKQHCCIEMDLMKRPRESASDATIRNTSKPMAPGVLYPILQDRLSFACHNDEQHTKKEILDNKNLYFFSTDLQEQYEPLCADFGPVNLGIVVRFCSMMDHVMATRPDQHIVYYCDADDAIITNTAFLIAAYLVISKRMSADEAVRPIEAFACALFRDASYLPATFLLSIRDCLGGIQRALELGWLSPSSFNANAYDKAGSPEEGHIHFLCPKFLASAGPTCSAHQASLPEEQRTPSHRASFYAAQFKRYGVKAVIRLNDPSSYATTSFAKLGIQHYDIETPECSIPTTSQVTRFLDAAAAVEGRVAVHCQTGLDRTGTMIGLWLMKEKRFSAREAMGWMRVVRPGSVLGIQQHYLERMGGVAWDGNAPTGTVVLPIPCIDQVAALSLQMRQLLHRHFDGLEKAHAQPHSPGLRPTTANARRASSGSSSTASSSAPSSRSSSAASPSSLASRAQSQFWPPG